MLSGWVYYKLKLVPHNKEKDGEVRIDLITWKMFIKAALKKYHGLFGEGIEYYFLNQQNDIAYLKVDFVDKEVLQTSVSSYISGEDLVGVPLTMEILQVTNSVTSLETNEDDKLWINKEIEE